MPMLALIISLFLICAASFVLSSWLIRIEYDSHRDNWLSDGEPSDYFGSVRGKYISRMAVSVAWALSTPDWMKRDRKALAIVYLYRLTGVLWMAGIITLAVLASEHHSN